MSSLAAAKRGNKMTECLITREKGKRPLELSIDKWNRIKDIAMNPCVVYPYYKFECLIRYIEGETK
jgi:hypothetical protein